MFFLYLCQHQDRRSKQHNGNIAAQIRQSNKPHIAYISEEACRIREVKMPPNQVTRYTCSFCISVNIRIAYQMLADVRAGISTSEPPLKCSPTSKQHQHRKIRCIYLLLCISDAACRNREGEAVMLADVK
jgi:hypothetical protein